MNDELNNMNEEMKIHEAGWKLWPEMCSKHWGRHWIGTFSRPLPLGRKKHS